MLIIWGAFAIGIGIERVWPAADYGGAPASAWLSAGAIAIICGTAWKFR